MEVYIAVGSNLGDRVGNIRESIRRLNSCEIRVDSTGFLYKTEPMYFPDQPHFLNTVVRAFTALQPIDLMLTLQSIEKSIGRKKTVRNGPRALDLDILFYGEHVIELPELIIPHPRLNERFFVLSPLKDISPHLVHPISGMTVLDILNSLETKNTNTCIQVTPNGLPDGVLELEKKSYIMGILNVTPDSFSDGGLYTDLDAALVHARGMIAKGADLVDVGGESTRPNAPTVDTEEEISRVVNVIRKLRHEFPNIPISIDTYKAATAREAVAAGASIVNDVSGGLLDPEMLATVSELGVPYICMHAGRVGTHIIMESCLEKDTTSEQIVESMHAQLSERVHACMKHGIPRWDLILDPGLGFGKTGDVNFHILRNLDQIFSREPLLNFPVMIGASRKRFVRDLEGGDTWKGSNHDAMLGTAAVTVASIASPARVAFHRVHDVSDIRRVVDVADRIYRRGYCA